MTLEERLRQVLDSAEMAYSESTSARENIPDYSANESSRDSINNAEDDVAIDEFTDEIEAWVIDALKTIGCDTAKSVLDISAEDLVSRTDLEIETVEDVLNILGSEFED